MVHSLPIRLPEILQSVKRELCHLDVGIVNADDLVDVRGGGIDGGLFDSLTRGKATARKSAI